MRAKVLLASIDLNTVITKLQITLEDLQANHSERKTLINNNREALEGLANVREIFNDLEQINEELIRENTRILKETIKLNRELKELRNFKKLNIDKLTKNF